MTRVQKHLLNTSQKSITVKVKMDSLLITKIDNFYQPKITEEGTSQKQKIFAELSKFSYLDFLIP